MGNSIVTKTSVISGRKQIDTIRNMVKSQEVMNKLTAVDGKILKASAKSEIGLLDSKEVAKALCDMLTYIAIDVGYKITSEYDWKYAQARIYDVVTQYYGDLTLSEIKLAFELLTVRELDIYLPLEANKQPDGKHYQHFNADYVGKILTAYKARKAKALEQMYKALPSTQDVSNSKQKEGNEYIRKKCIEVYLTYKYCGKLIDNNMLEFVYRWLNGIGYANEVVPTSDDRHRALMQYRNRVIKGLENKMQASFVMRTGKDSKDIDYLAKWVARDNEIRRALDELIKEEIYIYDII